MPLTQKYKDDLIEDIKNNQGPCRRCGYFHGTRSCKTPLDSCYTRGRSDLNDQTLATGPRQGDIEEAEQLWKDSCAEMKAPGKSKKKKNPVAGSGASKNTSNSHGRRTGTSDKKERVPIYDPELGKVEKVAVDSRIDSPPAVDKFGICSKPKKSELPPSGRNVMMIRSNYVRVNKVPQTLYVYSLKFTRPGKENSRIEHNKRREVRDIFQALAKADALGLETNKVQWVTDFKNLWSTAPITKHSEDDFGYAFQSDEFECVQPNGKKVSDMRAEVVFTELLTNIDQELRTEHLADLSKYIRALNANVAQCVEDHQKHTGISVDRVGANKFYLTRGYVVMDGLRARRGYYTSIRPGSNGTLLNINPATSAFLPPVTVSEFIDQVGKSNWNSKLNYIGHLLKGATVKILYRRSNYEGSNIDYNLEPARLKTFSHFGFSAQQQKFYELLEKEDDQPRKAKPDDNGTTVFDYFKTKAKVQFLDSGRKRDLICVNIGKSVRTKLRETDKSHDKLMREQSEHGAQWIPAYLLQIMPGQMVKTTLNGEHTKQMIKNALRLPAENAGMIEKEGLEIIGVKSARGQQQLASMDFQVGEDLVEVPATTLPQPKLYFHSSSDMPTKTPDRGQWNLENVRFADAARFGKLHMLVLSDCFEDIQDSVAVAHANLVKTLKSHGLQFEVGDQYPNNKSLEDETDLDLALDNVDLVRKFFNKYPSSKDCIVILIPEKDYDLYASVKRLADFGGRNVLLAIGSKFINKKGSAQFMSNLALKVNMKFGGFSHRFDSGVLNKILTLKTRQNTIVLGADIGHSSAGGRDESPSIASVVGSVDADFMTYPGSMRLQRAGQENIENKHMKSMVQERLKAWREAHGDKTWPTHMLFYRDGISESQFNDCIDNEIGMIKEAYKDLSGKDLKLTFVICGKRHHTRFYATEENQTYRETLTIDGVKHYNVINGNLKPGLLVTKVVTNPKPFNFFLQSHLAIKGTARSAHYYVLEDGMSIGDENIPKLTMMLCYAFGRATTGVSYAAPAYIADRLCERGRIYLRKWNSDPDMEPKFIVPIEKGVDGKRKRVSREKMDEAKAAFADTVANCKDQEVWGKDRKDPTWLNPWNPVLNQRDGMFWM